MTKYKLRKSQTCLNCGSNVDQRFCPNCSQENVEIRKSFAYLFVHFFEDLTHYDNKFWLTTRYNLFRPAYLSSAYLSGKRLSYLEPFRYYLFLSFICFFIISIIPRDIVREKRRSNYDDKRNEKVGLKRKDINRYDISDLNEISIHFNANSRVDNYKFIDLYFGYNGLSIKEFDSIENLLPDSEKDSYVSNLLTRKVISLRDHYDNSEIINKFDESFRSNLPKALLIIMPIFAFLLWIFHNKKKRYYFDNGIFTIHYFCFILLVISITYLINSIIFLIIGDPFGITIFTINIIGYCWMIFYFFIAHYRFYGESKIISFLKCSILLFVNFIIIIILLILIGVLGFLNLH